MWKSKSFPTKINASSLSMSSSDASLDHFKLHLGKWANLHGSKYGKQDWYRKQYCVGMSNKKLFFLKNSPQISDHFN